MDFRFFTIIDPRRELVTSMHLVCIIYLLILHAVQGMSLVRLAGPHDPSRSISAARSINLFSPSLPARSLTTSLPF